MTDPEKPDPASAGRPVMHQSWGKLLFMHWPIPAALLRPLIPAALEIDTHEGTAWIGVVPFTMWDIRPAFLPAIPGLSESHELNVRTYVRAGGENGVWFFSLDASNAFAVAGARALYSLPYFLARMNLESIGNEVRFESDRRHPGARAASLRAVWSIGDPLPPALPGTLDFFLTERYALFASRGRRIYRTRIHHPRWQLRAATLARYSSSMLNALALPEPTTSPLLHHAENQHVDVWRPQRV